MLVKAVSAPVVIAVAIVKAAFGLAQDALTAGGSVITRTSGLVSDVEKALDVFSNSEKEQ